MMLARSSARSALLVDPKLGLAKSGLGAISPYREYTGKEHPFGIVVNADPSARPQTIRSLIR